MAITPKEALGQKREVEAAEIDAFEKKIEDVLRRDYDGRKSVTVDPSGVSAFVRDEVTKRFEKAGWVVKFTDSQRDGAYLTFSPAMGRDDRMDC